MTCLPPLNNKPEIITPPSGEDERKKFFLELKDHLFKKRLIGLPTETVYGLAANGFDQASIELIYEMKKRPKNDPIILHVHDFSIAIEQIYSLDSFETNIVKILSDSFSPGPLTIVAKAKATVPSILSNYTGFQGVRVPDHNLTREFLRCINIPLAAPSANMFGHISPTTPHHVLSEFPHEEIYILDGGSSSVGIESTVVKIHNNDGIYTVSVCRPGAITFDMICDSLISVKALKIVREHGIDEKHWSPGQVLCHYSPEFPTFLLKYDKDMDFSLLKMPESVLYDISGEFKTICSHFTYYIQAIDSKDIDLLLDSLEDIKLIQKTLFSNLRKAEKLASNLKNQIIFISWFPKTILNEALYDRIYRASHGQIKELKEYTN